MFVSAGPPKPSPVASSGRVCDGFVSITHAVADM